MTDWLARWRTNDIRWHQLSYNERLLKYIHRLELQAGQTIFVPLCGKSLDMQYLLQQGYRIIGVELSELAIVAFFKENHIRYHRLRIADFLCYQADNITFYVGDFFNLSTHLLSDVAAVYDRAAFVALDADMQKKYAKHLSTILPNTVKILLLTLNYPQQQMSGPPFAVDKNTLRQLFSQQFHLTLLENIEDAKNEPKFVEADVDFLEKTVYLLTRPKENFKNNSNV